MDPPATATTASNCRQMARPAKVSECKCLCVDGGRRSHGQQVWLGQEKIRWEVKEVPRTAGCRESIEWSPGPGERRDGKMLGCV